jgi:hypothetical protein
MEDGPHLDVMREALEVEGGAQRLLIAGDASAAAEFRRAAALYRQSWELAPPRSFGRLIGMLKASVLAGDAREAAEYALAEIGEPDSAPSSYAVAVAALVVGDDGTAADAAAGMRAGGDAFVRAADAIAALADRDGDAYARAVDAIVADFASREEHLTGVSIADTALMLDRLAEPRGMSAGAPLTL